MFDKGAITQDQKDHIVYLVTNSELNEWKPLVYITSRSTISKDRLREVRPDRRAGMGPEYFIEDLKRSEFDIIEFPY
jgi:hypothetical protein